MIEVNLDIKDASNISGKKLSMGKLLHFWLLSYFGHPK